MNTKDIGDLGELSAAKKLISQGKSVSFPFGDNERYDLIIDNGEELKKAQVRKGVERDGYIVFKCYSNHRNSGNIKRESFDEAEIDCFLVWHREENNIYEIPIEETPKTEMRLRLSNPSNNQSKKVNWAENYLLTSS